MKTIVGLLFFIILMIALTFMYAEAGGNGMMVITAGVDDVREVLGEGNQRVFKGIIESKECMDNLEVRISLRELDQNIYLLRYGKMTKEERLEIKRETLGYLERAKAICKGDYE